ncbi:DNA translocase FtsK [Frigidibacter sp. ROC022]|uniref:DNA translocase FtsK n=1 Tax=Frigidibacter sp. ROC022 TaxID=2971796 RepID=UPI00215A7067|nr:DNA translocase FtsK [Frigidibacter sp. ROC022]MCR8724964.1 DNA translocase FtsK [Frigidibacter sp. ROC022]
MAYQVRQRDPLFDRTTQAVIERRGKELLGVGLLIVAVLAAMILGSYTQDDPSWLSATDEPAANLLGRFGASLAQPTFIIVGWGGWALPLAALVWGLRFVLHRGEERALGRAIFTPMLVALASVYSATHVPSAAWTHSFGMGGLFGDTVLGAILNILPFSAGFGLKMMALLIGVGLLAFALFVLGFTPPELRQIGRFLMVGIIMTYAAILRLLRVSGALALAGSRAVAGRTADWTRQRLADRAEARARARAEAEAEASVPAPQARGRSAEIHYPSHVQTHGAAAAPHPAAEAGHGRRPLVAPSRYAEPSPLTAGEGDSPLHQPSPKPSLLSRVPSFLKRHAAAEAEVEDWNDEQLAEAAQDETLGDDRIRAKIASVINARARAKPTLTLGRAEPPVQRPRGPQPILFDKTKYPNGGPPSGRIPPAPPMHAEPETLVYDDPVQPGTGAAALGHEPLIAEPLFETEEKPQGYRPSYGAPIPDAKKVVQHPPKKTVKPSRQARAEAQPRLAFDDSASDYEMPPLSLLASPEVIQRHHLSEESLEENARMLEAVLDDYGVKGEIVAVRPGPVVTMYELEPAPGLKASRVIGLADDIARSMSALSARVSTVPGRSVIGIELPNAQREKVLLREILSARDFGDANMRLPLALGKDIGGDPIVANLAKMPHLLIAGTTGSGKSVAINTMILSLLYKLTPEECRLIMIDPKMLELSVYDGIPHLLSPVVTDPKKAVVALKWVVGEMEERYRKMSKMGVRNIEGFNGRVREALAKGETFKRTVQTGFDDETGDPVFETDEFTPETLPYIVVIVDEMADLMMVAGKEIEACIQRLAQMARASGIHLIMATQRPSVDVITGTIKANFPTRISFQVTSKIDSRTILGEMGAEQLLGMGDMLYMAGGAKITRVHGPFVSDEEVEEIVNHLKSFGPPEYFAGVIEGPSDDDRETSIDEVLGLGTGAEGDAALYDMAVAIVAKDRKCSTSYIQRKLAIGYNKAARLVETMEENGVVSAANHVGKREILVPEH